MKIAFIGQKGIPALSGGVEKHVNDLALELVKRGHQVFVYTRPNYTSKFLKDYQGIKLISRPSIPTKHLDAISHTFLACWDAIFLHNYDVIHFHSIGPSSLIWLVRLLKPRTPVIATYHAKCYEHKKWGEFAKSYLKFGEFILCHLANRVVAVSETLKKHAQKAYGCQAIYIPNGVYIPKVIPAEIIKEQWGLAKNSYFLLVSRLIKHKGIHYAIEAFKQLKTKKKLVIVGGGSYTDDYVAYLEDLAIDNPNIIFTGEQTGKTLAELFSNAYLFINPSESEGLSISLLEAMSYGLSVLVSDIAENKEAIGQHGFIFKNKNVTDLAKKLHYLLTYPQAVKQHNGKGKTHVQDNYSWNDIAEATIEMYREALMEKMIKPGLLIRLMRKTVL